jgi:ubiquinone/menaquinone biosynthesis C-methylase UbiE
MADQVHPAAAEGFAVASDAYERARPDYPRAAVEFLADRLELRTGRRLLDLAAGTGKLTRQLLETGVEIVAVEPVGPMRAHLSALLPSVDVRPGVAEQIPLADGSVDAVTVAQAFHWFRAEAALGEIHRVLRPGGALALLWNTRDENDGLQRTLTELLQGLERGTPRRRGVDAEALLDASPLFGVVEAARFPHAQELDEQGFVERTLSISFVASAPEEVRARTERRLRDLAAGLPRPIVLPYVTEVYVAPRG